MRQHLQRDIDAPDLTAAGLRFAGGRIFVVNARPVAEFMYTRDRGRPIGICITAVWMATPHRITVEQRGAERLASWIADGFAYLVVGEIDNPTAQDIARRVAAQNRKADAPASAVKSALTSSVAGLAPNSPGCPRQHRYRRASPPDPARMDNGKPRHADRDDHCDPRSAKDGILGIIGPAQRHHPSGSPVHR